MKGSYKTAGIMIAVVVILISIVTPQYKARRTPAKINAGPGVTEVKHLSDYFSGLKGTAGDTEVYILDSGKPGGTIFVLGGTHPNEPAGYLAATLLVENAKPEEGRLIVIPRGNNSGFSHSDAMEGTPSYIYIKTAHGHDAFLRQGLTRGYRPSLVISNGLAAEFIKTNRAVIHLINIHRLAAEYGIYNGARPGTSKVFYKTTLPSGLKVGISGWIIGMLLLLYYGKRKEWWQ